MNQPWGAGVVSRALISIALALAAGCSDDAEPSTDAAAIDARADAPIDAVPIDAPIDAIPIDAPIDAIPIDADPSACTIDGVYTGAILATPFFFRFTPSTGAWMAAMTEAGLATPLLEGTFTFAAPTLSVIDNACPATATGQYTVAFAGPCNFTLTLVTDPCTDRGAALNGAMFTFAHP
jgi:hypothetical protein